MLDWTSLLNGVVVHGLSIRVMLQADISCPVTVIQGESSMSQSSSVPWYFLEVPRAVV